VFWSMEYNDFSQIGFPNSAVTELNPAHRLAFWRYSSDQVAIFNQAQVEILRELSPGRDVIHNYMGNFAQFDHHKVSKDNDVASWDNYPLGFLTRDGYSEEDQKTYLHTGHPDSSAFHHDLYRGCNQGRWWVMEQQPGPVNWAPYNPAPLPGMVRFWGWEAIAHGAEVVSYFRWRQCPFAQEQMHTGLLRPDNSLDVGGEEATVFASELLALQATDNHEVLFEQQQAPVALLFDYDGIEAQRIQQPDGKTFDPFRYAQQVQGACRSLDVDVDIIVGSKTIDNSVPENLAPGALQSLIPVKVNRSESLPGFATLRLSDGSTAVDWRETMDSSLTPRASFEDGVGFHYVDGKVHYLNACLTQDSLIGLMDSVLPDAGVATHALPAGVRSRKTQGAIWVFNFGPDDFDLQSQYPGFKGKNTDSLLLGEPVLKAGSLAMWRT